MTPASAENAYWNLVVAAKADYGVSPKEQKVLNAHVVKLGLDAARAREIQADAEAQPAPVLRGTDDAWNGVETLRAVLEVAGADGSISPSELAVARALANHLRITEAGLENLIKAALSRSAARRDKAFGQVKAGAAASGDVKFVAPVAEAAPRGEFLRTVPFAARLAPLERVCARCKLPFADRNHHLRSCWVCIEKGMAHAEHAAATQETLYIVFFVLLFIPAALLLHLGTGLWGLAWASPLSHSYYGRRGRGSFWFIPWLITAFVVFLPAHGLTRLALPLFAPKKRDS